MKKKIAIGLLLLVIGALVVGAYMVQRGVSTRAEPMQMEKALATTIRVQAIPSRYKAMKNPVTTTPEVIHEGMAHWADHCTACHANNGSGDTMYGKAMYPSPPDTRQKDSQEMSDGELYYTIKNGVRLSGMPAFGIRAMTIRIAGSSWLSSGICRNSRLRKRPR
jgi:mono/diheme cytochrome c family protein